MDVIYHIKDIDQIANEIIQKAKCNIIRIDGELGAGKTTLIKAICKIAGVDSIVQSPTFSIINQYTSSNGMISHFDFYRIKKAEEAIDLGILDLFQIAYLNLIEWGENIQNLLPLQIHHYQLMTINNLKRKINQLK
ncbi:MAG: tRNA (adenosine(37)-N6)-threonylcarbamoyltransferase complex ATPase subunit type 1 TsaE [Flavobacteriaceae bacterium]|nr:tRNA (adenosine(37)-N6)-threonylcarbamoyltransferase complex ATPase subunit type 1 TsaE [Flavobacteriaceae bacterium]MCY4267904.1 tRNA (adenosine(37)-N6)-threonylcarbamoyltransferase complex ATPase subunit type 1 TsaE [Flavobacteriaceae bacterium]MCY4299490.1 tRNA (adenosine(37)-N6)-threonylcarbamoyltransferase complex ATPase subunit type 1 TsaE [Flavobacteriaceae bacterium]